jgi:uncharacterized membrane protein
MPQSAFLICGALYGKARRGYRYGHDQERDRVRAVRRIVKPPLFAVLSIIIGLAYVAVTPPFTVPDEGNHFWRSIAISRGHFISNGGQDVLSFAKSSEDLIWIFERKEPREALAQKLRLAAALPFNRVMGKQIRFASWYTPMPYVAQSLVAALPLRPLTIFYAGRIANLLAAIVLVVLAIRAAPAFGGIIAAVSLLPMSLYEMASWSADAATMALAWLFTALLLGPPRRISVVCLAGFALSLCKPAYFLIALLAFVVRARWRERLAVVGTALCGTLIAFVVASRGAYNPRHGLPIDAAAQIRCIVSAPLSFARVAWHELAANWRFSIEEMIGRFGATDVTPPVIMTIIEVVLLLAVAVTAGHTVRGRIRLMALAVVAATVVGILLSQYLIWSVVCGDAIEGVQGRYFLEILPLFLAAIAFPRIRLRMNPWMVIGVAMICNAMALLTLFRRYW